jgi:hypothetical protein
MDRNSILSLLKEGDMTYADFRAKGHYPRKELGLLQESDIVEKVIIGGKIRWHLKEQFGEKEMEEITEGLNKAITLMEEYLPEDTKKITIETETKNNAEGIPETHREVTFELEKPVVPPPPKIDTTVQNFIDGLCTIPDDSKIENGKVICDTATQTDDIIIETKTTSVLGQTVIEVEEPKKRKWFWQK